MNNSKSYVDNLPTFAQSIAQKTIYRTHSIKNDTLKFEIIHDPLINLSYFSS